MAIATRNQPEDDTDWRGEKEGAARSRAVLGFSVVGERSMYQERRILSVLQHIEPANADLTQAWVGSWTLCLAKEDRPGVSVEPHLIRTELARRADSCGWSTGGNQDAEQRSSRWIGLD